MCCCYCYNINQLSFFSVVVGFCFSSFLNIKTNIITKRATRLIVFASFPPPWISLLLLIHLLSDFPTLFCGYLSDELLFLLPGMLCKTVVVAWWILWFLCEYPASFVALFALNLPHLLLLPSVCAVVWWCWIFSTIRQAANNISYEFCHLVVNECLETSHIGGSNPRHNLHWQNIYCSTVWEYRRRRNRKKWNTIQKIWFFLHGCFFMWNIGNKAK